mgnify:CR=1 FL=1
MENQIRNEIVTAFENNKAVKLLLSKTSNQESAKKLQAKVDKQIDERFNQLDEENKEKLKSYIDINEKLKLLKEQIESTSFQLKVSELPKVKEYALNNSTSLDQRKHREQIFERLNQQLNGTDILKTQLNLFGSRTHRITTQNYNLQSMPTSLKKLIMPNKFKKIYTCDFNSFDPCIVAWLSKDEKLIHLLNSNKGLYNELLSSFELDNSFRNYIKQAFIGSFLFEGQYEQFDIANFINKDNWYAMLNQFSNVKNLQNKIKYSSELEMPYGITHKILDNDTNWFAIYIQTIASFVFKYVLHDIYNAQQLNDDFLIKIPIHDSIMIECNDLNVANRVAEQMKNKANEIMNCKYNKVKIEEIGDNH